MNDKTDELYPNAAILVAFSNSPLCKPDAASEKAIREREEMVNQLKALQEANERERKRIEALEKAAEARKRRKVKENI